MHALSPRSTIRPLAVAAATLVALSACGAPPPVDRVAPIQLTEGDHTTPAPGAGAEPVQLPGPADAGRSGAPADGHADG